MSTPTQNNNKQSNAGQHNPNPANTAHSNAQSTARPRHKAYRNRSLPLSLSCVTSSSLLLIAASHSVTHKPTSVACVLQHIAVHSPQRHMPAMRAAKDMVVS